MYAAVNRECLATRNGVGVLDASTLGKIDDLTGFKENVIMGHIIPAGTGYPAHCNVDLKPLVEPEPFEEDESPLVFEGEPMAG